MTTPETQSAPPSRKHGWARPFGPFLTQGLQLALTVVVCFFLGRWLDGYFGTGHLLTIVGLVVGIVGGMLSFFRAAIAAGKEEDRKAAERRAQRDR